jgi:predicted component of type VI protein secretion system
MKSFYQVNWINGMKINAGHFIDLENHFISRIQQSISGSVNDLTYGLIPSAEQGPIARRFQLYLKENKIRILHDFAVISPEGFLFQIPANQEFELTSPAGEFSFFNLVIIANPYSRKPIGEINSQESPLRHPDSVPEFRFDWLPQQHPAVHILARDIIPVGRFSVSTFDEDLSYIPPCVSVNAHPVLFQFYKKVQDSFTKLEVRILEQMRKSNLNASSRAMLVNLMDFLNLQKTSVDWYLPYQPPVMMFEKIHQLARVLFYSIDFQKIQIKDNLRAMLVSMLGFKYDHLDITQAVEVCSNFLNQFMELLPKDIYEISV